MTQERFQQLSNMTPVEGVNAWLHGDFGTGEGPALIKVIRKDRRITLSDDEMMDMLCDAAAASCDAQRCLDDLTRKTD
ncbi:MAG TPA: hypothetical protein VJA21_11345 [Verrucomicrobiae bacterium]